MLFRRNDTQAAEPAMDVAPVTVPGPQMTVELRNAVEQVEKAVAEQRHVESALSVARANMETAQREIEESNQRLSVAEATAALSTDTAENKTIRKQHLQARDSLEFATARVAGLQTRLREAQSVVIQAKHNLAVAWKTWSGEQAAEVLARYERALESFIDEVKVVRAAAAVLGHAGRLSVVARNLSVPDPHEPYVDHANPSRLKNWSDVPAARDLNERLADVAGRVVPLIQDFVDKPVPVEEANHAA